jgi:hypothetical protein
MDGMFEFTLGPDRVLRPAVNYLFGVLVVAKY